MGLGGILFTDLVGFTEFTERHGDGTAIAVLDAQARMLGDVLAAHGDGRVVKELGDGLLVWFDDPWRSLAGARTMLDTLGTAHDDAGFPLRVRMGLHVGDARWRGDDVVGHNVNLAARIAALAGPGELLVSDAATPAGVEVATVPVGPTRIRGVAEPVWLHRVIVAA